MATEQLFADRYKLDRRLGVGGMATVQLAFDTRLERNVAVKLLAEHLAEDASFVSRFRREALAAARLVHPNIVQVFDFGSDSASGRQFIVMEYVDGHSCAELLRDRGPMSARDAVEILGQACRGLDYAHRNGVVHRDVKPGNLMVNTDGVVKLADFGIAKAAEQSDITKVGSVLGTAAYLSPEQARGEPAGPASDIYALGVVSYQLMAGRLPYEAASLTDLARLQESGPPPRLQDAVARRLAARWPPPSPARWRATRSAATPTPPRWRTRCATAWPASRRTPRTSTPRARCPTTRRRGCSPRRRRPAPSARAARCSRSTSRRAAPRRAVPAGAPPAAAAPAEEARRRGQVDRARARARADRRRRRRLPGDLRRRPPSPSSSTRTSAAASTRPCSPSRTSSSRTRADQLTTPYGS